MMPVLRRAAARNVHQYRGLSLLGAALMCLGVACFDGARESAAQTPAPAPEPVPVIAAPPPSAQEQRLTPIPRSFDWIAREVRPNPLLENLLGLQERAHRLLLSISLSEEYSDNFRFGRDGEQEEDGQEDGQREEFRTRLSIGTVYRLERGTSFVSLANTISATYDAHAEESNVGYANLALSAGHQIGRLSLALSDSLSRDDDTGEASRSGIRRRRQTFLRNSVSPQLRYALSPLTSADLAYTNTVTLGAESDGDTGVTHTVSTGLQHRFSRVLTGGVRYGYTVGSGQTDEVFRDVDRQTAETQATDTQAHNASVELGYLIDRVTSVSWQGFGRITDRANGGVDSQSYGFSLGGRRQLTSSLSVFASIGPTFLDREDQGQRVFFNWQASLDGAIPISRQLSLTLSTQQNITDTSDEVSQVGLVLTQAVALGVNYTIARDWRANLLGSYVRTEFLENFRTDEDVQGRTENFWRVAATVSYALSRTVSLTAGYVYQQRDSRVADSDFEENRFNLTLSSTLPVF